MIKNKQESKNFIKQNNLNTITTSKLFTAKDIYSIQAFLNKTNFDLYGIRENRPSGLFTYAVEKNKIIETILLKYLEKEFTICESMWYNDKYNMILQGDFVLTDRFIFSAGYNQDSGISLREASWNFPTKIWNVDLKEKRLDSNIEKIVDYLVKYNLFNLVVELTLYKTKVGINKEDILIWEVRDEY